MLDVNLLKVNELKTKIIKDGYLWDDEMEMSEHRAVAIRLCGTVPPNHEVHHINHRRTDNRPVNLIVLHKYVHAMVHASEMKFYFDGMDLRKPDKLCNMLSAASIPYTWLGDRDLKGEQPTHEPNKERKDK